MQNRLAGDAVAFVTDLQSESVTYRKGKEHI